MTRVFSLSQLPSGHMHAVKVGERDVLLANVDGEVYAVENKCSHYQFALDKGALCEHRVRCPLHHACFDVRTGEQLEAPGMDGLPRFEVEVKGDDIHVSEEPVTTNQPDPEKVSKVTTPADGHYPYVIVGGGTAAAYAVEAIRANDETGAILMLSKEDMPPYDRTKVSKGFLQEDMPAGKLPLRSVEFYNRLGVTFRAGAQVQRLDLNAKEIRLSDGSDVRYDRVLMATGGKPIQPDMPGVDLDNVFTLRQPEDALAAREATGKGSRVVIIGSSFIGLESAMGLGKRGGKVTVIAPEEVPFGKVFGEKVGKYTQKLHEDAGVSFQLGRRAESLKGDGKVKQVVLDDGTVLPADVVIIGIGVRPNTDYVEGIAFQDDHSIAVDGHLAAHAEHAWAAGDIATYPDREGMLRIEHWKVAGQQGRIAGRNMAGASQPYQMLPFFWTNQQGVNFRYVGHATDYDDIVYDGEPGTDPFLAFYVKDKHVQACLGVKRDAEAAAINELMSSGKMPSVDKLKGQDWAKLCREV